MEARPPGRTPAGRKGRASASQVSPLQTPVAAGTSEGAKGAASRPGRKEAQLVVEKEAPADRPVPPRRSRPRERPAPGSQAPETVAGPKFTSRRRSGRGPSARASPPGVSGPGSDGKDVAAALTAFWFAHGPEWAGTTTAIRPNWRVRLRDMSLEETKVKMRLGPLRNSYFSPVKYHLRFSPQDWIGSRNLNL